MSDGGTTEIPLSCFILYAGQAHEANNQALNRVVSRKETRIVRYAAQLECV